MKNNFSETTFLKQNIGTIIWLTINIERKNIRRDIFEKYFVLNWGLIFIWETVPSCLLDR